MRQIPERLLAEIYQHAEEVYPEECCGVLVQQTPRSRVAYLRCTNIAEDKKEAFHIADQEMIALEDEYEILGIVHSHPDCLSARPSPRDIVVCNRQQIPYHIVSYPHKDYQCVIPEQMPLIGRPFILGETDCWGLMLAWHKQYGITLPDTRPHPDYIWWNDGKEERYVEKDFIAAGFERQDTVTAGCLIIMQVQAPVANHAGLILPDGQMLHHLYGELSRRTIYGDYWRERTWYIWRHKDLPAPEEIQNVT